MDELKLKFFDLIRNRNISKVPIVDYNKDFSLSNINSPVKKKNDCDTTNITESFQGEDMHSDSEILNQIDRIYFNKDFNTKFELEKLNGSLDMSLIENNLHKLQTQLRIVSKRVLHMILENQTVCQKEFDKMVEIQQSVSETLDVCRNARMNLDKGQKSFTTASLGILSNYRKRKVVQDLLRSLRTIKTLSQMETQLLQLLQNENFSDAISLLLECQQAALTYKHFQCIAALSGKLQDTLVMAEEQLDVALAKMCYKFDGDIYSQLQIAYSQLGKRRIAMDQLHMHFTSAIHSTAFNVVHKHVSHDNLSNSKKPYLQLCKQIKDDKLIECLINLCQSLWKILRSYDQITQWHNLNQFKNYDNEFEQNINEQYIKQKLESGLGKLWHDIQSRVSILISNSNVANFKFDDFLQVLSILHKLVQIGEEFCGSDSVEIQSSIKDQSSHYFRKYHLSRLEELRLFLENEAWTPCPVKPNFNLLHLQEFRNLRNVVQNASYEMTRKKCDSFDHSSSNTNYFSKYAEEGTPFDFDVETDSLQFDEDILITEDNSGYSEDSDEEDTNIKYKKYSQNINHINNNPKKSCILLTNTTLTVLRHCGRYLQMSRLLNSITSDVLLCVKQLFQYYLYAVSTFFTVDIQISASSSTSYSVQKLLTLLKRIEDTLMNKEEKLENNNNKVIAPCISPTVDLRDPETLYGLSERVVGVESLIFLAKQYILLRDYFQYLIEDENDKHSLELFYSQEISMAVEVRKPVYECVARQIINSKYILSLMSKVNWEVKDVMCEHSEYVDVLFRELQAFVKRLESICNVIFISTEVINCLWYSISEILADLFVEGFSNTKKCSNGGRALMQLDFTQLMSKLEVLSPVKPIPKREFVETYVKAYYLPETTLQNWIQNHSEYTSKQLQALVNCTLYNNKRARQKLISLIEEVERR